MIVFGTELRRLRRQAGLSQEALAARAGLSPEAISLLERGRRSPRVTTMRLLAEALDLSEASRDALFAAVAEAQSNEPSTPLLNIRDPLVGREDDLDDLTQLTERDDTRLITLLGPGGVGKSRLAIAFMVSAAEQFPSGVHWLSTGFLEPGSLLPCLTELFGITASSGNDLREIVEHLRTQHALLILDHAGHEPDALTEICSALVNGTEHLKVMVISRHELHIPGERTFILAPLEVPEPGASAAEVQDAPASRLFLSRAGYREVPTRRDLDAVIRICQRLDGLPLALELAAARTNVLAMTELADSVESELQILHTVGPNGALELVEAMVGLSYHSLTLRERTLFSRLSVFNGSFGRDAVTAVCGEGWSHVEVMDLLAALISRSLVYRFDGGSPYARFRVLNLIRRYGRARLAESENITTFEARHAHYYCAVAEQSAEQLRSPDHHKQGLTTIDRESDDLRHALAWSVHAEPEIALRIVGALSHWWFVRGRHSEGRRWASAVLQTCPDSAAALRAPVLASAGLLALMQCDYAEARGLTAAAQELFMETSDEIQIGVTTSRIGSIDRALGDYDAAERAYRTAIAVVQAAGDELALAIQLNRLCLLMWLRGRADASEAVGLEALAILRRIGDREELTWAVMNLGIIARIRGDLAGAELLLSESLDLAESMRFRAGIAWMLNQLGIVARLQGQVDRAQGLQEASLIEHRELGDRWRAASVHDELAAIALQRGDPREAASQLGRADRLRLEISTPVPAFEVDDRCATVAAAQHQLGVSYAAALVSG